MQETGETGTFRQEKIKIGKIGRWFEILDRIGIMNLFKLIGVVKTKDKRQVSVGGAVLYLYLLGDFKIFISVRYLNAFKLGI